jgi:hypothetical protein
LIIRIALILTFAALTLFISADILLLLTIPKLSEMITQLGLVTLLSAFSLLVIIGLLTISKLIGSSCIIYFSAGQRLQRRLLFILTKQQQLKQLFYFKKEQIHYVTEHTRKRLLVADNRQQIKTLSTAISNDLKSLKHQLPKNHFLQLQKENIQCREQQDIEALIQLQQKIATIHYT